jgi:hypothetical protein
MGLEVLTVWQQMAVERLPPNKRMKLTSLSAAPGKMEVPPRAPAARMDGRTGSQLIRGVLRTLR